MTVFVICVILGGVSALALLAEGLDWLLNLGARRPAEPGDDA